MRCTSSPVTSSLSDLSSERRQDGFARPAAAIVAAAAIATRAAAPATAADVWGTSAHITVVDDAMVGKALLGRFDYVGSWQHVRGKHDGRSNGTSTRSTHTGDVAIFRFTGTRVRIYGVRGPSGGRAGIALDESSTGGHLLVPRVGVTETGAPADARDSP